MKVANPLAYYDMVIIAAIKSFIVLALFIKQFVVALFNCVLYEARMFVTALACNIKALQL
jgi:hypothetical protein